MSVENFDAEKYGKTSGIRLKIRERKIVNKIMKRRRIENLKDLFCAGANTVNISPELIADLRNSASRLLYVASVLESTIAMRKIAERPDFSVAQEKKSVAQKSAKQNDLIMQGYSLKEAQEEINV